MRYLVVARLLERGDVIERVGMLLNVVGVDQQYVYYSHITSPKSIVVAKQRGWKIGINSKEKITLVERKMNMVERMEFFSPENINQEVPEVFQE